MTKSNSGKKGLISSYTFRYQAKKSGQTLEAGSGAETTGVWLSPWIARLAFLYNSRPQAQG